MAQESFHINQCGHGAKHAEHFLLVVLPFACSLDWWFLNHPVLNMRAAQMGS